MIKCIKWLRRIIIAGFVFMISVYSISYIIEAPDLNGGHIIRMYDQNQQLFINPNNKVMMYSSKMFHLIF